MIQVGIAFNCIRASQDQRSLRPARRYSGSM
jgi:hypothetical protein